MRNLSSGRRGGQQAEKSKIYKMKTRKGNVQDRQNYT